MVNPDTLSKIKHLPLGISVPAKVIAFTARQAAQRPKPLVLAQAEEYVDFGKCAVKLAKMFLAAGRVDNNIRGFKTPLDDATSALIGLVSTAFYRILNQKICYCPNDDASGEITNILVPVNAMNEIALENFPDDLNGRAELMQLIKKKAIAVLPSNYPLTIPDQEQVEKYSEKLQLRMRNTIRNHLPHEIADRRDELTALTEKARTSSNKIKPIRPL